MRTGMPKSRVWISAAVAALLLATLTPTLANAFSVHCGWPASTFKFRTTYASGYEAAYGSEVENAAAAWTNVTDVNLTRSTATNHTFKATIKNDGANGYAG